MNLNKSRVLAEILSGKSISQITKELEISASRIYKMMARDPEFQREVNEYYNLMSVIKFSEGLKHIESAIKTVTDIMNNPDESPKVRIQAANTFLKYIEYGNELSLQHRVTAIENQLNPTIDVTSDEVDIQ